MTTNSADFPTLVATCAGCQVYACSRGTGFPDDCPTPDAAVAEILAAARRELERPENMKLAAAAARIEALGYCKWTRLEETIEYARLCGFHRLGVAFCTGLKAEAKVLVQTLEENGFEVATAVCKFGSLPKETLGLTDAEKVRPGGFEAMCNPIGQAALLDAAGSEFSIVFGLCVGHDTLFLKHTKAPATVLVAKDRVLAHNPIGALYCQSYYRNKLRSHRLPD